MFRRPGLRTVALASLGFGLVAGTAEVGVLAAAEFAGSPAAGGLLLSAWSVVSVLAGVLYGMRPWPRPLHLRLPVLPGHGPELPDAAKIANTYLAHREQRLEQVRTALAELGPDASAREVVEVVYTDVDTSLWDAAELSVRAQLDHLRS